MNNTLIEQLCGHFYKNEARQIASSTFGIYLNPFQIFVPWQLNMHILILIETLKIIG